MAPPTTWLGDLMGVCCCSLATDDCDCDCDVGTGLRWLGSDRFR